ncbi:MAG: hypothetical protein ACRDXX_11750 [Stackebrandtia sp.]
MSLEQLKHLLSDMADDVNQVPVHQRALAQSRRIGIQRAVLAGITALAVLGGGVAAATAFSTDPDQVPMPSTSDESEPLPTGDVDKLDGVFYDAYYVAQGLSEDQLVTWSVDEDPAAVATPVAPVAMSVNVSPDGRYASWLNENYRPEVADLSQGIGGMGIVFPDSLDTDEFCSAPVWSPDSKRLFVTDGADSSFFWDAGGEEAEEVVATPRGCHVQPALDEDGEDVLFSIDRIDGQTEIVRTDATGEETITEVGGAVRNTGQYLRGLVAVSPEGRFACVHVGTEDDYFGGIDEGDGCTMIVDTVTGEIVDLPVKQNDDEYVYGSSAVFSVPGRLLVQEPNKAVWQLYDYNGNLLDSVEQVYIDGADPDRVGYVPNSD